MTAPRITASEVPSSPSSSVTPTSHHASNTHPSSRPTSGGAIEQNPSTPPLSVGAIENKNSGSGSGSGVNDQPDVTIMPFLLGDGEEEKASSFVPSSIAGSSSSRAGRPVRWSMAYLRDNAEKGCGKIFGMGNFGETGAVGRGLAFFVVLQERRGSQARKQFFFFINYGMDPSTRNAYSEQS